MKKKLLIAVLALAASAAGLTACNNAKGTTSVEPSSSEPEAPSFVIEVRAFNGADDSYNPKIDGTLLASKKVDLVEGQITVADALNAIAPLTDGAHKIYFNDTDYLSFSETTVGFSTSWFLDNGYMSAQPDYTAGDYSWSYMAYNGHYSNGVTIDFLEGLSTYTVVIDGYDGNIGVDPVW